MPRRPGPLARLRDRSKQEHDAGRAAAPALVARLRGEREIQAVGDAHAGAGEATVDDDGAAKPRPAQARLRPRSRRWEQPARAEEILIVLAPRKDLFSNFSPRKKHPMKTSAKLFASFS